MGAKWVQWVQLWEGKKRRAEVRFCAFSVLIDQGMDVLIN